MSITSIFTGMVAIAKAIPVAKKWFNDIVNLWIDHKVKEYTRIYISKENKQDMLRKKIQEATNDDEISILSSVLHDINNK